MKDQRLFDLSGKVTLISGASRGIGEAIAFAFSQAGAKVVLASRKQVDLDGVAQRIREAGGEALPLAAHTATRRLSPPWWKKPYPPTAALTCSSTTLRPIPTSGPS